MSIFVNPVSTLHGNPGLFADSQLRKESLTIECLDANSAVHISETSEAHLSSLTISANPVGVGA